MGFDLRHAEMRAMITPERAAVVRRLRVDDGESWRGVAAECNAAGEGDWDDNQIAGMARRRVAAAHFGEEWRYAPWN